MGLPEGVDIQQGGGFGHDLVRMLVVQIRGRLKYASDRGTSVTITFPLRGGNGPGQE